MSHIGDLSSRALLEEVEIYDDGALVEPMFKGRF